MVMRGCGYLGPGGLDEASDQRVRKASGWQGELHSEGQPRTGAKSQLSHRRCLTLGSHFPTSLASVFLSVNGDHNPHLTGWCRVLMIECVPSASEWQSLCPPNRRDYGNEQKRLYLSRKGYFWLQDVKYSKTSTSS